MLKGSEEIMLRIFLGFWLIFDGFFSVSEILVVDKHWKRQQILSLIRVGVGVIVMVM